MRIAVFSDIHGNCFALDRMLADLERHPVDTVVCLGDAIQGGPQPAETVARLRELGCPVVMGNADAWLLTGEDTGTVEKASEKQLRIREWSLSKLSAEDIRFIQSFQPTISIPLEGGNRLLCFHGSPTSFDDLIFPETPEDEFQRLLGGYANSVFTGGHTHLQQIRRIGDSYFFNPGSVGVVYDRNQPEDNFGLDPWAEYAILSSEGEQLGLEFRRVPYDVEALLRIYEASGKPYSDSAIEEYRRGRS